MIYICTKQLEITGCKYVLDSYEAALKRKGNRNHDVMILPGRVLHLVRQHDAVDSVPCILRWSFFCLLTLWCRGCSFCPMFDRYEAKWIENDSLDEIIISPYLMRDHMPDVCASALSYVSSRNTSSLSSSRNRTQKKKINSIEMV